jgi:glutamate dehydrogenase/leucine dehydrogenase
MSGGAVMRCIIIGSGNVADTYVQVISEIGSEVAESQDQQPTG